MEPSTDTQLRHQSGSRGVWITGLIILVLIMGRFIPGAAQDTTEDRIDGLETRVAALEAATYGTPAASPATLASPIVVATPAASPGGDMPPADGTIVTDATIEFRGSGSAVSDDFTLEAGSYRVRVEVPVSIEAQIISITLQPAPGSTGSGFAGLVSEYGTSELSGEYLVRISTAGTFVFVADGDRSFTIVLER